MTSTLSRRPILKTALALILGLVLLPGASFVALGLWFEQAEGAPPQLADGALHDFGVRNENWSRHLAETFPVGTPEATVTARLREEGFEIAPTNRSARYEWGSGFPCVYTLTATWSAESGRVTEISGDYLNACM
ncbi:hypothetical protein [Brevundimonas sp.]|uniref:hypothetical protein n=1 Tax=Brevundimonas sp. TaxID=1871086 RepID=UPI0027378410|nr:hypothetical protein [Brevundimonas sp.]MDP3800896.1 hypothetical protein [Brevundimonas sp.]